MSSIDTLRSLIELLAEHVRRVRGILFKIINGDVE